MERDAREVARRGHEIQPIIESLHNNDRSNLLGSIEYRERRVREYMEFANEMRRRHGADRESREKFDRLVRQEKERLNYRNRRR